MKQKEINKKSDKDLLRLKKDLEMNLTKAYCSWGSETVKNKEAKILSKKGLAQQGTRTKLRKQIRKTISQINNNLVQRGLSEEVCKDKYKSKRRVRRLRGRKKIGKR